MRIRAAAIKAAPIIAVSALFSVSQQSATASNVAAPVGPRVQAVDTTQTSVWPLPTVFGLPVEVSDTQRIVVLSARTFIPRHPIRGTEGTPVVVAVFTTADDAALGEVALSDPSTQRTCASRSELYPGPAATSRRYPGDATGTVAHRVAFVCPERVRSDLLVTIRTASRTFRFQGPLA